MKKKIFSTRKTLFFKRFQRKSYAVFNSLKREICIAVLPVACLTFVPTSNVLAQSHNLPSIEHNLREIEVLGESPSEQMGRVAGIVSVIHREEIATAPVQSIQDLLDFVSSVDVRKRGVHGVQADISIRGSSADQVLILLNGINITDPQTGHYNLNIPIDLSSVSRVEILYGSGSRVLGGTPFGGAINIITGEAEKTEANVEITAGDFGFVSQKADATILSKSKAFSNLLSFSHQRSNGYIDNTDFQFINAYLHSSYTSEKIGRLQFQFGFQDKGYGANSFYSLAYPNQYDKNRTFFSALSWNKKLSSNTNLMSQMYWRQFHDRFELFRDFQNSASFYTNHNYHQTDIAGVKARLEHFFSIGKTTVGIDARNEHIFSNVLGEPMKNERPVLFEKDAFFTKEKNRFLLNAFAEQTFYIQKFTASGGLSLNYSNDYDFNMSGGIDLEYSLLPALKCYASVNHAYRLPTFTDLYYTTATHISNPDLKPEHATVFEAGLKYSDNQWKVNSAFYYRMANDVIDWIKMPDSVKWESRNYTKINAFGADFSAQYLFNNSFLRRAQLSYSYLNQDKNSAEYDSRYALDYLKHKLTLGLNHKVYKRISMNWNLSWQDRNGSFSDFATNEKVEYKPFFLADVRAQWSNEKIVVYVDVNNIFDKRYEDFGGLPQAGRWINTGIRVNL